MFRTLLCKFANGGEMWHGILSNGMHVVICVHNGKITSANNISRNDWIWK